MPIRNPFAKRQDAPGGLQPYEEGIRPLSQNGANRPAFEKVDTMGSTSSGRSSEPVEYKLSVVNDSGVYLPPSPPEKKSFWPRRAPSAVSNRSVSETAEIEAFSISRESFDSYRRSFDISARSPVVPPSEMTRQSLDSARIPRLPRSAMNERRFERQPPTAEEGFEDVGLNDENKQPKKTGFFSKFGNNADTPPQSPSASTSRFHLPGRKRGVSTVGEEMGSMERPDTANSNKETKEVK